MNPYVYTLIVHAIGTALGLWFFRERPTPARYTLGKVQPISLDHSFRVYWELIAE